MTGSSRVLARRRWGAGLRRLSDRGLRPV